MGWFLVAVLGIPVLASWSLALVHILYVVHILYDHCDIDWLVGAHALAHWLGCSMENSMKSRNKLLVGPFSRHPSDVQGEGVPVP
jgi:hypothetical protein